MKNAISKFSNENFTTELLLIKLLALFTFIYYLVKAIFSAGVFPAQFKKISKYDLQAIQVSFPDLSISFSKEKTEKNRLLETITIQPKTNKENVTILIFNGQNATFRDEKKIRVYCQMVKDTGCKVVGFDYGGTARRKITTWSHQPLVDDGFYLAKKLIAQSNSLVLKGNSLGGAIATLVAKQCHEKGILVYLWNGRSFASASHVIAGQFRTLHFSGHYENTTSILLSKIAGSLSLPMLVATGWEIDAASAYKMIPEEYKNYYLVRSSKDERLIKKDDVVIPYHASLEARGDIKALSKEVIVNGDQNDPSQIAFYRARRKFTSEFARNAHGTPEINLYCRHDTGYSAYKLFCLFVKQYVPGYVNKLGERNKLKEAYNRKK